MERWFLEFVTNHEASVAFVSREVFRGMAHQSAKTYSRALDKVGKKGNLFLMHHMTMLHEPQSRTPSPDISRQLSSLVCVLAPVSFTLIHLIG